MVNLPINLYKQLLESNFLDNLLSADRSSPGGEDYPAGGGNFQPWRAGNYQILKFLNDELLF